MRYLLILMMLARALTEQPGTLKPVETPSRSLPWGKLNFLHTTDTHGWYAGHFQEPQYSADWGDYISFAQRLREKADSLGVDLLVIDTGDRIEGNGLYDASNPKGKYSYDIFKEQHIDILNAGNHELYYLESVEKEYSVMIPSYKDYYIASNLDYIDPTTGKKSSMAHRYRIFTTKNQRIRVAAFGFMFNFRASAPNSFVQRVEDTINEKWFQKAIREDVDIFLISVHAPLRAPEHLAIYNAIRSQNKNTPIQFFGGHTHVRNFVRHDAKSYGIQSGRYMETIGWMSIDWKNDTTDLRALEDISFQRRYIDANVVGYQYHIGLNATIFPTELGKNVSAAIHEARKKMDLSHVYGCAPMDLFLHRTQYRSNNSILTWLEQDVAPNIATIPERAKVPRIVIINSSFMRFDIFKGPYTRDTAFVVTPFLSKFKYIRNVPYKSAKLLLDILNHGAPDLTIEKRASKFEKFGLPSEDPIALHRKSLAFSAEKLGYVTKDDAGSDGDDTDHEPVPFYPIPLFIQSQIAFPVDGEPESIDLVFIDFIQPVVLLALKYIGESYNTSDSEVYRKEPVSELINGWLEKNWPC